MAVPPVKGVDFRSKNEVVVGEKKVEDRRSRATVDSSFRKFQEDFASMNRNVDLWQVAEEEKKIRQELPPLFKWFCPRINTVSPLIRASKAVKEVELSQQDLGEKITRNESDNRAIPNQSLTSNQTVFSLAKYAVVQGVRDKLSADSLAERQGMGLYQLWKNEHEAVVSQMAKDALIEQGQSWGRQEVQYPELGEMASVEEARIDNIKEKAVWNVYQKVGLRMALTVGVVSLPIIGLWNKRSNK